MNGYYLEPHIGCDGSARGRDLVPPPLRDEERLCQNVTQRQDGGVRGRTKQERDCK